MGNTLVATQKIACGHTDRRHLQLNLLCDRLSKPTADMAEALLELQGNIGMLSEFASSGLEKVAENQFAVALAMSYCILFRYDCPEDFNGDDVTDPIQAPVDVAIASGPDLTRVSRRPPAVSVLRRGLSRDREPAQPGDFVTAFKAALLRPQEFLQDLLTFQAQSVPREQVMRVLPLVKDPDCLVPSKDKYCLYGEYFDVLSSLSRFIRALVDSAEIYAEIQENVYAGRLDAAQAAMLVHGEESDQRRMISAMGAHGFEISKCDHEQSGEKVIHSAS